MLVKGVKEAIVDGSYDLERRWLEPVLIKDLGHDEESVGIVGRIRENDLLGETLRHGVLPDHVEDGDGMGRGFDPRNVEAIHLLHMVQDPSELTSEKFRFLGCDFEARKSGQVRDINCVMGGLRGIVL
jgi:hypothetical protein